MKYMKGYFFNKPCLFICNNIFVFKFPQERKKNTIKDFLSISGYLHVSHMMVFTETELGSYMRLARLPRGPTLTFRIHNVSFTNNKMIIYYVIVLIITFSLSHLDQ